MLAALISTLVFALPGANTSVCSSNAPTNYLYAGVKIVHRAGVNDRELRLRPLPIQRSINGATVTIEHIAGTDEDCATQFGPSFGGLLTYPWVFHRGSGGQRPPRVSMARAISAVGEWNP